MVRIKQTEALLAQRVSNYLRVHYPDVVFRFDASADIRLTMGQSAKLKRLQGGIKSYPDLFIARPSKGYCGLYVELKATKNGKVPNTEHTRNQAKMLLKLRKEGYAAFFAVGYDNAVKLIKDYLS